MSLYVFCGFLSSSDVMLVKVSEDKNIFLDNISVKRLVKIVEDKDKFLAKSLIVLIKEHERLKLEQVNSQIENARNIKQIKKLVKDLKDAVKCVEKSDKGLADILEGFIADAVIKMKLTKEQALEWDKWFYEVKG